MKTKNALKKISLNTLSLTHLHAVKGGEKVLGVKEDTEIE